MSSRRPMIAANWKMNGLLADGRLLARAVSEAAASAAPLCFDVVVCPPATLTYAVGEILKGSSVLLGAQDCVAAPQGAFTGDLSAPMFADLGAKALILGHSERRHGHGETSVQVAEKVKAAQAAGLITIVCVGETAAELDAGCTKAVLTQQVRESVPENVDSSKLVIAYEPVWAIGTGRQPVPSDVVTAHQLIRSLLGPMGPTVRILYGGSVNAANVGSISCEKEVDGVLVGGASLKAESFWSIAESFQKRVCLAA